MKNILALCIVLIFVVVFIGCDQPPKGDTTNKQAGEDTTDAQVAEKQKTTETKDTKIDSNKNN